MRCLEGVRHYAFIGLRTPEQIAGRFAERARLRRKYGVAAIFFAPGKNYEGLTKLLACLKHSEHWPEPQPPRLPRKVTAAACYQENKQFPSDPLKGRFGWRCK
jgi:hypothetical protein